MSTKLRVTIGLLFVCLLIGASTIAASAQSEIRVEGNPDINVYVPDDSFTPGEATQLTLQLDNEGEVTRGQDSQRSLVTTARNVVVTRLRCES